MTKYVAFAIMRKMNVRRVLAGCGVLVFAAYCVQAQALAAVQCVRGDGTACFEFSNLAGICDCRGSHAPAAHPRPLLDNGAIMKCRDIPLAASFSPSQRAPAATAFFHFSLPPHMPAMTPPCLAGPDYAGPPPSPPGVIPPAFSPRC